MTASIREGAVWRTFDPVAVACKEVVDESAVYVRGEFDQSNPLVVQIDVIARDQRRASEKPLDLLSHRDHQIVTL